MPSLVPRAEAGARLRDDATVTAPLTTRSLRAAARHLTTIDPALGASVASYGPPPLWSREPGFAALVHLILEQQVSLASAQAAYDRLAAALGGAVAPTGLLRLSDEELRAIGFSRQKTAYARGLATAVLDGFDLPGLAGLDDDEVRMSLMALRGVGRWTADVYLAMCLLRPDVWPRGDLALATSAQAVFGMDDRPADTELAALASRWQPYRAVAARILWHDYLRRRNLPV
jgi:DNA-3-methyladenine glycosylase II